MKSTNSGSRKHAKTLMPVYSTTTSSGITDTQWNQQAFESLTVPETHKSLVKALVSSHTFDDDNNDNGKNSRTIDDVTHGKGRGLVTVLHAPPGTGKTLTAEGIVESLHRPLYTVSAGDMEMEPRGLEIDLTRTLDIAQSWRAVLLLDEADVFLEQRRSRICIAMRWLVFSCACWSISRVCCFLPLIGLRRSMRLFSPGFMLRCAMVISR